MKTKLWSGQINYKCLDNTSAYCCIVIRDGVFHNLSEDQRLDLIKHLESLGKKSSIPANKVDLEDMF